MKKVAFVPRQKYFSLVLQKESSRMHLWVRDLDSDFSSFVVWV